LRRNGVSNARSWQQLHRFAQPSSIGEYRTDVPLAVNDVLQKALAKQPHERYATVHAFASDLFAASHDTTQIPPKLLRSGLYIESNSQSYINRRIQYRCSNCGKQCFEESAGKTTT